jgi:hypothetical protein
MTHKYRSLKKLLNLVQRRVHADIRLGFKKMTKKRRDICVAGFGSTGSRHH